LRQARISSCSSGVTRSSASSDSTQSEVASASARFFWMPKPCQSGLTLTSAPRERAICTVSSVLPESSTTTWSAKLTERRQAAMLWASLWVMTVTDKLANECLFNDVGEEPAQEAGTGFCQ
jgi:cellulase/cellobiase CelA1